MPFLSPERAPPRKIVPGTYVLQNQVLRPATMLVHQGDSDLDFENNAAQLMSNIRYVLQTAHGAGGDISAVLVTDNQNLCHVNLYNMSFAKLQYGEGHDPVELGRNLSAILRYIGDIEATRFRAAVPYGHEVKGVPLLAVGGLITHDFRAANLITAMTAAMHGIESDFYPANRQGMTDDQLREKFKNVHDADRMCGYADFLLKSSLRLPHALRPLHDYWTYQYYKYAEPDYEPRPLPQGAAHPGRHLS